MYLYTYTLHSSQNSYEVPFNNPQDANLTVAVKPRIRCAQVAENRFDGAGAGELERASDTTLGLVAIGLHAKVEEDEESECCLFTKTKWPTATIS